MQRGKKMAKKRSYKVYADLTDVEASFREIASRLKSLDRLSKLVRSRLGRLTTRDLESTFRTGKTVIRVKLTSRRVEAIRAALRALNLDIAHKILRDEPQSERNPNNV